MKRQVDDFAVAAVNEEDTHKVFDDIDDRLSMPMKRQGLITLFNGIDIFQSTYYVKMSVQTYIQKMATKYAGKWDKELEQMGNRPLPMLAREEFWRKFMNSEGPRLKDGSADTEYQEQMKKAFGFGY